MKKILFILVLFPAAMSAYACNTCGCAATNQYLGILTELSGHFIGLQYQYRWYESRHEGADINKPDGKEFYNTAQIWGRYSVSKRIQLFAFMPWQYNTKLEGGIRNTLSGIGDVTVLANVQILRPKTTGEKWQHYLQAGGGIKAPTGAYDNMVLGSGDALAPSMQAGTGSWDFVANANYTLRHGSAGLNAEAAYTMTMPNRQDYKYGNRVSGSTQAFYQLKRKDLSVLPSAGVRYEYSEQDYDNYTVRSRAQYTGGYMMYASVGFQAYYRHWGLTTGYYKPVSQHYGEGLVSAKGKAEGGLVYLFR